MGLIFYELWIFLHLDLMNTLGHFFLSVFPIQFLYHYFFSLNFTFSFCISVETSPSPPLTFFFYLFIFGCVGSSLLRAAFSSCGERGLLFVAVRGLLIAVASLVAEHGL